MTAEWTTSRFDELSINFDGKRRPVKESDRRPGPYPYYGASGVVDHVDDYIFDGDYLLVAEDGENLRTRQTPIAFLARGRFWVNNHAHIVAGNERADTRFLAYALRHADIDAYLTGAVMPKLTQGNLNRIEISHPLLPEQRAIAGVLGALDDKIEQNRRTARALEGLARTIFRAWFVDFEPVKAKAAGAASFSSMPQPVFDALPTRFVDSDIGPVPEGWEVKALSSVCTLVGGGTPKRSESAYWGGDVPWYSVKDAPSDGEIWVINTSEQITDHGLANSAARIVPKGSTIISARGTVGKLAMSGTAMAFNQSCYGLLPGNGSSFGHLHLLLQAAVAQLQQRTHGSVFDTITGATFDGLMVAKPKDDVVSAFEVVVAPLLDVLLASLQESSKLAEMRDYLLPKLLSSQVRVEVARG